MSKFIITGMTSGIGYALTLKALQEGHKVLGVLRNKDQFIQSESYTRLIEAGDLNLIECDMLHEFQPDLKRHFLKVLQSLEEVDYLFHFAGYLEGGAWEDLNPNNFKNQMQVNVLNIHALTRLCFPYFSQGAKVYAAGSVAGHFSYPLMGPYCTSKHALRSMFDSWYFEASYRGVQFCHLSLGPVKTPFWDKSREANSQFSPDYEEPFQAITDMSKQIEKRGLAVDKIVTLIWKSLHKKKLPKDMIIVKNYMIDFLVMKITPHWIQNFFIRKLLKLPNRT